jgi:hypothetical protein
MLDTFRTAGCKEVRSAEDTESAALLFGHLFDGLLQRGSIR